ITPVGWIEAEKTFRDMPAEVDPTPCAWSQHDVHLFPLAFTDVADIEVVGCAIKGETPWITQAETPHFWSPSATRKGIVGHQRTGVAGIGTEPQDFSKENGSSLSIIRYVARSSAVPNSCVETAVWPKGQHPAIVIGIGSMVDRLKNE